MAFKPIDLEEKVSVVWPYDPAVDRASSDIEACIKESGRDPESWRRHLKFKDGERPCEFVIGVIPGNQLLRLESLTRGDDQQRNYECFRHSLRDMLNSGLESESTDPKTGQRKREIPKVEVSGIDYVDPMWVSRVMSKTLRHAAVYVGAVAYDWNNISEDDLKN